MCVSKRFSSLFLGKRIEFDGVIISKLLLILLQNEDRNRIQDFTRFKIKKINKNSEITWEY